MNWIIAALLVPVFQSIASLMEKIDLNRDNAAVFSFLFTCISFIILIPTYKLIHINLEFIGILFVDAALASIAFYYGMEAMQSLDLSEDAPLANLSIVLTGIIEYLLGQSFTLLDITGITLILLSSYFLETDFKMKLPKLKRGVEYVLIAAFIYSITANIDRKLLSSGLSPLTYLFFAMLFGGITLGILVLVTHKSKRVSPTWKKSKHLIIGSSIFATLYRFLQAYAVSLAPVTIVVSLKKLSSIISVILGGEILKEKHMFHRIIASTIMIAGAILLVM